MWKADITFIWSKPYILKHVENTVTYVRCNRLFTVRNVVHCRPKSFITTSAECVQVRFQQIWLRLCSKCPPLALMHAWSLVKVICFSQGTVATCYSWGGYIITYDVTFLWDSVYQKLLKSVHSFFIELFFLKIKVSLLFFKTWCRWWKQVKDGWWLGVSEYFFWCWLTLVIPDKGP